MQPTRSYRRLGGPWRMTPVRVCFVVLFVLVLAPESRGSPGQLLEVFIRLAEVASGQPRSTGTGCTGAGGQWVDPDVHEYLRIVKDVSEVAVVLDEEGHRPEVSTPKSALSSEGSSNMDLESRSITDMMPNRKKCPPGARPDRAGKCRKVVFDSKVWSS